MVDASCCAGVTKESHEQALEAIIILHIYYDQNIHFSFPPETAETPPIPSSAKECVNVPATVPNLILFKNKWSRRKWMF